MLNVVWNFIKHPVYQEDEDTDFNHRFAIFLKLLGLSIVFSFILGMIAGMLEHLFSLDFGKHAIDEILEEYPLGYLFLGVVFAAPILEELIFRGPLLFFKDSKYFRHSFYVFTLIFGFYHITNFEITTTVLLFSPLLVAPQLSVGSFLGYIRIRFGLLWSIALHACYNLILIGPIVLLKILNIPIE